MNCWLPHGFGLLNNYSFYAEALYSADKKMMHIIQMTNDRPNHRLNYQWQARIHFNQTM